MRPDDANAPVRVPPVDASHPFSSKKNQSMDTCSLHGQPMSMDSILFILIKNRTSRSEIFDQL